MKLFENDVSEIKLKKLPQDIKERFLLLKDSLDVYFSTLGFSLLPGIGCDDNLVWDGFIFSWKKKDLIIMLELQIPYNSLVLYFKKATNNNDYNSAHSKPFGDCFSLSNYLFI